MVPKEVTRWHSPRLERTMPLIRWGSFGTPVLLYPTAGGDAEEIERFLMIRALAPLLEAGRIKIYSTDSVAGRTWFSGEHHPAFRARMQNAFDAFIYNEVTPAIRADCRTPDIEIIAAGASIGAFNAVATVCRHPDAYRLAIAMSGTYDLSKYLEGQFFDDFYFSSPLHFLPGLEGGMLELLRTRQILLPTGEGDYENAGESWRMAQVLGAKGVPNRVDPWGSNYHHDWVTWREMLPKYLDEFA